MQDIHLITRMGPTPAGMLHELAQKKVLPPFTTEFEGAGRGPQTEGYRQNVRREKRGEGL